MSRGVRLWVIGMGNDLSLSSTVLFLVPFTPLVIVCVVLPFTSLLIAFPLIPDPSSLLSSTVPFLLSSALHVSFTAFLHCPLHAPLPCSPSTPLARAGVRGQSWFVLCACWCAGAWGRSEVRPGLTLRRVVRVPGKGQRKRARRRSAAVERQ